MKPNRSVYLILIPILTVIMMLVPCTGMTALAEEASPTDAVSALQSLQSAQTTDQQLTILNQYAEDYAEELEAGGWDIELDVRLAEELPESLCPKNLDDAVSDEIPEEMLSLKYIAVYRKDNFDGYGSYSTLLGSFLARMPEDNRAASLDEVQGVMILRESFSYNSNYTGKAYNRYYNLYLWKTGSDTIWKKQLANQSPPNAGMGTLYGAEVSRKELWITAREIFGGSTFEITDEYGNMMEFQTIGENKCCLLSVETAEGVTSLTVPQTVNGLNVTEIGKECMRGNENIESVSLPEGLIRISARAFAGCTNLVRVDLPSTLKVLGEFAFNSDFKLKDIEIPDSVQLIEKGAFYVCESLESVRVPASIQELASGAFSSTDRITSVVVAEGVTTMDQFPVSRRITAFYLPASLTSIESLPSKAVFFTPEGSYAMQWLQENGYQYYACESPEDMPPTEYITEGDFEFLLFNGEAALSAYLGDEDSYLIPSEAAGCPVTRVLSEGFDGPGKGGGSAVVPESVLVLDSYSTHVWQGGDYLKHLYITNPQTIVNKIFNDCTIHAPEGSLAQEFALDNNITFEPWDGTTMPF